MPDVPTRTSAYERNTIIGLAGEGPERLRRIADRLEAWQREHEFPGQLALFDLDPDEDEFPF